jgi:hypothetical protein
MQREICRTSALKGQEAAVSVSCNLNANAGCLPSLTRVVVPHERIAMNATIRNCLILGLFVVFGCAAPQHQSVMGRWKVSGTGDSVVLAKDASARMTRDGQTVIGSYRMGAPDVLILTFPSATSSEQPQVLGFIIRPEDWKSRTLRRP